MIQPAGHFARRSRRPPAFISSLFSLHWRERIATPHCELLSHWDELAHCSSLSQPHSRAFRGFPGLEEIQAEVVKIDALSAYFRVTNRIEDDRGAIHTSMIASLLSVIEGISAQHGCLFLHEGIDKIKDVHSEKEDENSQATGEINRRSSLPLFLDITFQASFPSYTSLHLYLLSQQWEVISQREMASLLVNPGQRSERHSQTQCLLLLHFPAGLHAFTQRWQAI